MPGEEHDTPHAKLFEVSVVCSQYHPPQFVPRLWNDNKVKPPEQLFGYIPVQIPHERTARLVYRPATLTMAPKYGDLYSRLKSYRVDVVGDYAGSEPFLVEGDSLLLHCFSDDKLDFQDGFQMLHATWLVEMFLHNLQRRNCNFHLVFVDEHAHLCIPSHVTQGNGAKYLLARKLIFRHLRKNMNHKFPHIRIHNFPSLRSEGFNTELANNSFVFMMMNDGASEPCDCPDHLYKKAYLRDAICFMVTKGHNAGLINGLEFRDTKVIADIIEGTRLEMSAELNGRETTISPALFPEKESELFDHAKYEVLSKYHAGAQDELAERLYLVAIAVGILLSTNSVSEDCVAAFLAHTASQDQFQLRSRSVGEPVVTKETKTFLEQFAKIALNIMGSSYWNKFVDGVNLVTDIADVVDGRLFCAMLNKKQPDCQSCGDLRSNLGSLTALTALMARKGSIPQYHCLCVWNRHSDTRTSASDQLLPFNEVVFDKHLEGIKLNINAPSKLTNNSSIVFRELTHWHNANRPLNRKSASGAKQLGFFAHRRNQRLMAEMMAYAASLTNAIGKVLEPETIVLKDFKIQSKGDQQRALLEKESMRKNDKLTKKQALKANIAAELDKKQASDASKAIEAWRRVYQHIDKLEDPSTRYAKAMQYLNSLPDSKRVMIGVEVELYALRCLLNMWECSLTSNPKSPDYGLAARIWDTILRLKGMKEITVTALLNLKQTAHALGLPLVIESNTTVDRKLSFDSSLRSAKTADFSIPLESKEFQLLHCGPYADRKTDSALDERVPFIPDKWQRRVLDAIDLDKSLFVVAPTSAGKTFISFYAMKKTLESSNDSVLVYVAPTKALVNQIAAEIQARFSKSYKHAGKSVWGIHTRDYRVNNSTGCQILVTVPHILQIMLLAPTNAKSWSARIKRIIFDEVHCIGQADDGVVWEQLLLFAPCPIIALSATVGNPNEFHDWLSSAQKARGHELIMIRHPHRYSDLRNFIYTVPRDFVFSGLPNMPTVPQIGLDTGVSFHFIHPVASLVNRSRGIPEDFSLEARDCFLLWKAMKTHETDGYRIHDSLDPSIALPSIIAQADIFTWSAALKQILRDWILDSKSPFDAVVRALGSGLENIDGVDDMGNRKLVDTVLPLLCDLHGQSGLPAILFNYDRSECESICHAVLDQLNDAEANWKASSRSWEKTLADWESWKKAQKNPKKKASGVSFEKGANKFEREKEAASVEVSAWENFDPNAPIDGFHFKDRSKIQPSELDVYAEELKSRGVSTWLIEALYRGLAVHHAGMNRKYRHVVEILFRKGYLSVVVATGTLALGINMPCKTVVFCGDSVFLTALNFRQAAGRAGRRGFDILGNVVFHGISLSKVYRMLSSRLPDLTGHFPITTTLVLRLCTLLSESNHSPFSVQSVDALLSQPRLYLGGDESRMAVLHHLRFSIEYLRRQFLLDHSGAPLNFAGCVSHLYYTEPSNFAFHALMKEGYFHRLCKGIRHEPEAKDTILNTMMLVLSHLFGRRYFRQVDKESSNEVVKQSPSMVFLPPLPNEAAGILQQHNQETLDTFCTYVRTFVSQHLKEDDHTLPMTSLKFGGERKELYGGFPMIRSPFVALSGHGDNFESISELCHTVRDGVFLAETVIPHVPVETGLPLNAYLLDFFKHGDITALVKANKIRKGEMWFLLNDFSMVLATIVASVTNIIHHGAQRNLDILDIAGEGNRQEEQEESSLHEELPAGTEATLPVRPEVKRKERVVDIWDEPLDSDDTVSGAGDSTPTIEEANAPAWTNGDDGSLLDILEGFTMLSTEFNEKFKTMWA